MLGALAWGLIWYPYRQLAEWGLDAGAASLATYAIALVISSAWIARGDGWRKADSQLALLGVSSGITNVGFVWATTHGEVMRAVLLFYLVPIWTAGFAWALLGERIAGFGILLVMLAIGGAAVMLWDPASGTPMPRSAPDWVALISGIGFGLSNVLVRRADEHSTGVKSAWIFAGCVLVGALVLVAEPVHSGVWMQAPGKVALLVSLLGGVLVVVNWVVQYGIGRIAANRVPVIFIFEIVVAAASSWLLAAERVGAKEFIGGAMIVTASLLSAKISAPARPASLAPSP